MLSFLSALMVGVDRHYQRQMINVGPKIVYAFPGMILKERVGARGARTVEFDNDDIGHLAGLKIVESAAPNLWLGSRVMRAGRHTKLLWTFGVSADTLRIRDFRVAAGRGIRASDVERRERVAFLGHRAGRRLFGDAPAVGRTLHIDSVPFRVVGVAREKGMQLTNTNFPDDDHVLIPYTSGQRWFTRTDRHNVLIFNPRTTEETWSAIDRVRALLALHHDFDPEDERAVAFFSIQEAVQLLDLVMTGLRIFLIAAGLVTLLVGAIGVMNIMLVVVGERKSEIGLRKAVGASNAAIFVQFLAEGLSMTTLAGTLGGVLGWLLTTGLAAIAPRYPAVPEPIFDPTTVAVIVVSLILVGLVAAIVPASRASRVDPAVSLRSI